MRRIYPSEILVLCFLALAIVLYNYFSINFRAPFELYRERMVNSVVMYFYGLVVVLLLTRLRCISDTRHSGVYINWRASFNAFCNEYLKFWRIVEDVRFLNLTVLLFVVFINLKHLIPLVNNNVYDEHILSLERALFSGRILTEICIEYFGNDVAPILSQVYILFYQYMAILVFILIFQPNRMLARQFFCAFVLMWGVGILIVYLFPTWGPCFYIPESISSIVATDVSVMQADLLNMKMFLEAHPKSDVGVFMISGLPSLHFAVTLLGSLFLWNVNKIISLASWVFTACTAFATIYFGWHYVVDDIVAVVLVALCMWSAKWIVGRYD